MACLKVLTHIIVIGLSSCYAQNGKLIEKHRPNNEMFTKKEVQQQKRLEKREMLKEKEAQNRKSESEKYLLKKKKKIIISKDRLKRKRLIIFFNSSKVSQLSKSHIKLID